LPLTSNSGERGQQFGDSSSESRWRNPLESLAGVQQKRIASVLKRDFLKIYICRLTVA
jgi:hypothetical protein